MGLKVGTSTAVVAALCLSGLRSAASQTCNDFECPGVDVCINGVCAAPNDCAASAFRDHGYAVQVRGSRCRFTIEALHQAMPDVVTKEGTEYTLNKKIWIRDGCVLEVHGAASASSADAAVSLLKLKSDETSSAPIVARHGKISIMDTAITSYDASTGGPDERLAGRAFIAALSQEKSDQSVRWTSRMDVSNSDISYLGNEGDYHNDINSDYGLVWKVLGYDDRYPEDYDLAIFERMGVYGSLTDSTLHNNYMGAYCYGMKGQSTWSGNEVYDNVLNGLNPQDNSDDMTIHDNHVHDNGWHGIEFSKRCKGALVYNNVVEDNARAGIFFHRSTDYAEAYGNTCKRNLEGDFGIVECTGVTVHDNTMEGGKYGIRLSLGAQECDVYDNTIWDSSRYGVFFYRGSDEAEASAEWEGRPRLNNIRDNSISDPVEGQGVAVTGSDYNNIVDNVFVGIDRLRFVDAIETLVTGNDLPDGVRFTFEDGATLAEGSQSATD